MNTKQAPAHIKSIDVKKGIVTALVSVFGNVDAYGDVVLPGAFTNTIEKWKSRMRAGQYLPVVYGHRDDPDMILGKVIDLRQTEEGLEVDEQFFLDKPKARTTFDAISEGVLSGSSFSYDIVKAEPNATRGLDLAALDVLEVGSTLYPANDETRLIGVKDARREPLDAEVVQAFGAALTEAYMKAAGSKVGRELSAKNAALIQQMHDMAHQLLGLPEHQDPPESDAGKAEEPQVKAEQFPALAASRALFEG